MPDDPREILKAAGVECAEVDAWVEQVFAGEFSEMKTVPEALSIIGPLRDVVVTSNAAIVALARLVAPLARFLSAERALNDPGIAEGTTHRQTDAHVESDKAYREACAALGVDSFLDEHDA